MENNKTHCCEDVEFTKKVIKDKNLSFNENETGQDEENGDNLILEAESECGCGCGAVKYPDQSRLDNPPQPKYRANSDFIQEFENYARSIGIKSMGYAHLTPELLIVDKFIQYPHAMVLTMEMSKEIIETAPGEEAQRLNDLAYEKLTKITYKLSDYLRKNGFATEVLPPLSGIVNFSALAEKAGLGCRGKNGLLITPELGSRVKISTIFVSIANLPLKKVNEHNWIPDYCQRCAKCIKNCPEKALLEKEGCCGDKEIDLIADKFIGCSEGCTFCIEECPFVKKGYGEIKNKFDKINAKLKGDKMDSMMKDMCMMMMENMDESVLRQMCQKMMETMNNSKKMQMMPKNERMKEICKMMEKTGVKPNKND